MKTEWMVIMVRIGGTVASSKILIDLIGALDDYPTMAQIRELSGEPYTLREFVSVFNDGSLDMKDYLIHIRKVRVQELTQVDLDELACKVSEQVGQWAVLNAVTISFPWLTKLKAEISNRIRDAGN